MVIYLLLLISSILAGFAAILLYRRGDTLDRRVFLVAALLNVAAFLGAFYREWRKKCPRN